MKRSKSVDEYIASAPSWRTELRQLRKILRATELDETVKWGGPCYTLDGKNVVGLGAFQSYFGLWFHQGASLRDPHGVLINAQEGKTKHLRQWRFHSREEVDPKKIRAYVEEAIEVQRGGRAAKPARKLGEAKVPPELTKALRTQKGATAAFAELTPGKRREYAEYVAGAKREETKDRRIDKILPMILAGHGLNDRYRKG